MDAKKYYFKDTEIQTTVWNIRKHYKALNILVAFILYLYRMKRHFCYFISNFEEISKLYLLDIAISGEHGNFTIK